MSLLSKDEIYHILEEEVTGKYPLVFIKDIKLVITEICNARTTIENSNTLLVGLYNWVCSFCLTGNDYAGFVPKSATDCQGLKKFLDNQLNIFPDDDRRIDLIYSLGKEGVFHLPDDFELDQSKRLYCCLDTPMPRLQELAPNFLPGYQFITQLNKKINYYEQRIAFFSQLEDCFEKENIYRRARQIFIEERDNYIQGYKENGAKKKCLDAILAGAKSIDVSLKINEERSWFTRIIRAIIAFCTCSETEVEDRVLNIGYNLNFFANPTASTQTAKDLSEILNSQYIQINS